MGTPSRPDPPPVSTGAGARSAAGGSAAFDLAFQRLFAERFPMLYRYVDRLTGDAALADDVAQESFVRLYQRGTMPENPPAWLVSVAHNLVRDEYRTTVRRRGLLERRVGVESSDAVGADQAVISQEEITRVREVLGQLSVRERQLLLLRHEGHSYREIAEAIGVAPSSIGTLLARATAAFVAAYGEPAGASD